MKSYVPVADIAAQLGITGSGQDTALARAAVAATRTIDLMMSGETETADDVWTGSAGDIVLASDIKAAVAQATLALAVRFYKSPDVPYGIAGMSDQSVVAYVRSFAPEVELLLFGQASSWGVA